MNGTRDAGPPERLTALVARAASEAQRTGRRVLVSITERIGLVDPLAALRCAASAGEDDPAIEELVASGRMFWSHAPSELAFAAIGAAATIAPSGADRFTDADAEWRALLSTAVIEGIDDEAGMTAPVLVGGFAFDPSAGGSAEWRTFPAAHLMVPALRVTASHGRHASKARSRVLLI